jgi:hypothetical protein
LDSRRWRTRFTFTFPPLDNISPRSFGAFLRQQVFPPSSWPPILSFSLSPLDLTKFQLPGRPTKPVSFPPPFSSPFAPLLSCLVFLLTQQGPLYLLTSVYFLQPRGLPFHFCSILKTLYIIISVTRTISCERNGSCRA